MTLIGVLDAPLQIIYPLSTLTTQKHENGPSMTRWGKRNGSMAIDLTQLNMSLFLDKSKTSLNQEFKNPQVVDST